MSAFPKKFIHYLLSEQKMKYATCVASQFWLGAQRNKGMWGQRNSKEIGAGAMRNCLHGRVAFLSIPNACVWIVPFGSECWPTNQIFGNLPWEKYWLNKSSPQNKIKISKKRSQDHCQSWIFDGKTRQLYWSLNRKWPYFNAFVMEEMLWQFCPHQKPV